jgi:hypothetical protein
MKWLYHLISVVGKSCVVLPLQGEFTRSRNKAAVKAGFQNHSAFDNSGQEWFFQPFKNTRVFLMWTVQNRQKAWVCLFLLYSNLFQCCAGKCVVADLWAPEALACRFTGWLGGKIPTTTGFKLLTWCHWVRCGEKLSTVIFLSCRGQASAHCWLKRS